MTNKISDIFIAIGAIIVWLCLVSFILFTYITMVVSLIKDFSWGWFWLFMAANGILFIIIGGFLKG